MGKPYSTDLRERAVGAVLMEGLSRHESAARFGVAPSTVINWVRRFRETGVSSRALMGHPCRMIRRMRYGTSSSRERHDDRGGPSSDTAWSREPEGAGEALWNQSKDRRQVEGADIGR